MSFILRILVGLGVCFGALGAESAINPSPITRIADVRALSREEAALPRSVRVQGVVTWVGEQKHFTIQDETAGIWVGIRRSSDAVVTSSPRDTVAVGQLMEIEGVSDPAGYAPVILPTRIRLLGQRDLPPTRPTDLARFFSGAEDCLRVEVRGVVQGFQRAGSGWVLQLNAYPGRFTVELAGGALSDPSILVDAEVRVAGVAVTRFNTRGEITMPRVFSSQPDELIVERPATEPFAAPLVPLDRLMPFRPTPLGPHRLRVVGTVTFALPDKFLYLQDGNSAVRVETRSTGHLVAGDRVEAAGFVDMGRSIGTLSEAQIRKIGRGPVPSAVAISPEEIIELNTRAMSTGRLAQPHDYDGHLVRFRARLLVVQASLEAKEPWRRLTLAHGEMILSAILHAGEASHLDTLLPGSELEVTGIVLLDYTPVEAPRLSLMPTRLDVVLRSADDVAVVSAPSWWTTGRLLGAMMLGMIALGAALLWAWQLRRQVHRKTQQLATEMSARRDAAIEFQATLRERNRLAANLHDTLLQTLGGIGFQIEACEAEAASPQPAGRQAVHLPVARRMLDHAVDELRGSVWALRSLPLHGLALPEALRAMAERTAAGHDVQVNVVTSGDLAHVPDFVAGNLLLATQEAVHNALKHGRPRHVTVEVRPGAHPDLIALTVRDDGLGFTLGDQAGAAQGHFGLTGMRERIERLNGTLRIESSVGQGTAVHFAVPLRAYDEELA